MDKPSQSPSPNRPAPPTGACDPPAHVAIIMDGNGRWARSHGKERLLGHWEGYRTLKRTVYAADDMGIRYLTVYGFSSENWRRPEGEVSGLMSLMLAAMRAEIEDLAENGIRVKVIGRLNELPDDLRGEFLRAMRRTESHTKLTFTLAINYGGRAEIVDAVRAIAADAARDAMDVASIGEDAITTRLYSPETPDPDLIIRTAGELRLSNFLLWQSAYAEIWVTPTLWPDFTPEHLALAVADYNRRTRRFGAVVE